MKRPGKTKFSDTIGEARCVGVMLYPADLEALSAIQEHFGIETIAEAARLSWRLVGELGPADFPVGVYQRLTKLHDLQAEWRQEIAQYEQAKQEARKWRRRYEARLAQLDSLGYDTASLRLMAETKEQEEPSSNNGD